MVYILSPFTKMLTNRQAEILAFITSISENNGLPPSRQEIQAHFGFASINAVNKHLDALVAKGAIKIAPGVSRGISLTAPQGLPLVGKIAAGTPILAIENIDDHYRIDVRLFKPQADFLLRVRGLSMRDAGILPDDLVAIHRTSEARSGQIIAARIGDEVTLKRLRRKGHTIELLAENPDFSPIVVNAKSNEFVIEGIYVGIIRAA